jgi:hypothetical protein
VWLAKSDTLHVDNKTTEYHLPMNHGHKIQLEEFRRIIPVLAFWKPCFGMLNFLCGLTGDFSNTLTSSYLILSVIEGTR